MKIRGTLRRSSLEGGFWELLTEGGQRYQLRGKIDYPSPLITDNLVEIDGHVDDAAMGIGMVGPILIVKAIRILQKGDD